MKILKYSDSCNSTSKLEQIQRISSSGSCHSTKYHIVYLLKFSSFGH